MAASSTMRYIMAIETLWTPRLLVASSLLLIVCSGVIGLPRRLLFSPLAKIPGPKIAAVTWFWLWYWDIQEESAPVVRELHKQLGPIVRIGPNEVSINDVEVHNNVLYKQRTKFMKHPGFYDVFANETHSVFSTSSGAYHSQLRRLQSNSFARNQILAYEPHVWKNIKILSSTIAECYCDSEVLDLTFAFRSFALDVITTFSYGESFNALRAPQFKEPLLESIDFLVPSNTYFMLSPKLQSIVVPVVGLLPTKVFRAVAQMRVRVVAGIQKMMAKKENFDSLGFTPTLAGEIQAGRRSGIEVNDARLISDGIGSIFAGTDTTGITLAVGAWAIFSRGEIRQRLHADLKEIWPNLDTHPSLPQLEGLQYLRACVREALRLATPIQSRFPRVVPAEGWSYGGYDLPTGVAVSSSSYLMHNEELVFPNPEIFDPNRWLTEDAELLALREKYFAPFSLGVRQCIGLNLALSEVYIGLAEIVRNFTTTEVVTKNLKKIGTFAVTIPGGLKVKVRKITE
ncbi:cytochrome P450 [Cadophora sp. DSE1049]|nr:cytochrome P450 [Cadophora sp. DSE1049]